MSKDKEKTKYAVIIEWVLLFLTSILIIVPSYLLNGFILSEMWNMFIHPLGIFEIGVYQGVGIIMTIRFAIFRQGLATKYDVLRDRPLRDRMANHWGDVLFAWWLWPLLGYLVAKILHYPFF